MTLFIWFVVTESSSLFHSSKREWNRLLLRIITHSFFKKGGAEYDKIRTGFCPL